MFGSSASPEHSPKNSGHPAFADIVLPRRLARSFTYRIPPHLQCSLKVGSQVWVPFGTRTLQGLVVSLKSGLPRWLERKREEGKGLREILSLAEETTEEVFPNDLLALAHFVSDYYLAPLGQCLRLISSPARPARCSGSYRITKAGQQALLEHTRLAPAPRALLARLADRPQGLSLPTLRRTLHGSITRALGQLRAKQWITEHWESASTKFPSRPDGRTRNSRDRQAGDRHDIPNGLEGDPTALSPMPSEWQARVQATLEATQFSAILFRAPAASRVAYLLHAAEQTLIRHRRVLFITGEIHRAALLTSYARSRWGSRVELLHSRLSPAARTQAWGRIRHGLVDVVIGTRSAVFAPLPSLGLIGVDAEEEVSLKEEQSPRYHAREVAWKRAELARAVLVLGSNHPSLETRMSLETAASATTLTHQSMDPPGVEALDLREAPYGTLFSGRMLEGIEEVLRAQTGVILYHNRKGFAPLLVCRDCGATPRCPQCTVSLTYYRRTQKLNCHYCGGVLPLPENCPSCFAAGLEPVGFGTEWLEEEIRRLFPRARIARLDRDSSRVATQADRIRRAAWAGEVDILIGTQMLFRGVPLPQVGLVGIPYADAGLHLPDFRAAERTYHMLMNVVELAKPGSAGGRVILQTYLPTHHALAAVIHQDPRLFLDQEAVFRQSLAYPPFSTLVSLRVSGTDMSRVQEAADHWGMLLKGADGPSSELCVDPLSQENEGHAPCPDPELHHVTVLGPIPASVTQVRARHRWQLLVKSRHPDAARNRVRKTLEMLEKETQWRSLRFEVDVDPLEIG